MMSYINVFVAAVLTANHIGSTPKMHWQWQSSMGHFAAWSAGAKMCLGVRPPTSIMAMQAEEDETVVFSWIEWPDKATRDAAWPKIMSDPLCGRKPPFYGQRAQMGAFENILECG